MSNPTDLSGDEPLFDLNDDEFGLDIIVGRLVATLSERVVADGYALGIEGPWGSGKSTLANFIAAGLDEVEGQIVFRFHPWLIGERNALLASFLGQFATQISQLQASHSKGWWPSHLWRRLKAIRLAQRIQKYGERLGTLSASVGSFAVVDHSGATVVVAGVLRALASVAQWTAPQPSLEKLKSQIAEGLRELGQRGGFKRVTAIIDDTDRLEPKEAVEILRLIRMVADFPMTTYLVCFDSAVLCAIVSKKQSIVEHPCFWTLWKRSEVGRPIRRWAYIDRYTSGTSPTLLIRRLPIVAYKT